MVWFLSHQIYVGNQGRNRLNPSRRVVKELIVEFLHGMKLFLKATSVQGSQVGQREGKTESCL